MIDQSRWYDSHCNVWERLDSIEIPASQHFLLRVDFCKFIFMRISVVIPALNEARWIERAIDSAKAAGMDEILVADGGSEDGTPQLAADRGASVVHGPRGRAVQQNLAARHATGDILLFMHADNWLDPTVGQQIRDCCVDSKILGGAFLQRIEASALLYRLIERGNAARVRWTSLAYGDQGIFMRREVFDQLGGFPEVKLMEDLLLMRAFRKLARPQLLPGPIYVHPRRWQERGIVRQTFCNWALVAGEKLGLSLDWLAKFYYVGSDVEKNDKS